MEITLQLPAPAEQADVKAAIAAQQIAANSVADAWYQHVLAGLESGLRIPGVETVGLSCQLYDGGRLDCEDFTVTINDDAAYCAEVPGADESPEVEKALEEFVGWAENLESEEYFGYGQLTRILGLSEKGGYYGFVTAVYKLDEDGKIALVSAEYEKEA